MNEKWEYHVLGINNIMEAGDSTTLREELNKWGAEGWELINIVPQVDSHWGSQPRVEHNIFVFKRRVL